jgi:putative transposase
VEKMAKALGVARSGYYSWIEGVESARALEEKELVEQIQQIQSEVRQVYGSLRMREELLRRGHVGSSCPNHERECLWAASEEAICAHDALGKRPGSGQNLIDRNFEAPAVSRVWVSDITYVATSEGWMYLCIVLDHRRNMRSSRNRRRPDGRSKPE